MSGTPISPVDAFSPHQGATELVVQAIGSAQRSVRLVGYTFTAPAIADALMAAQRCGIDVRVVLDATAAHRASSLAGMIAASGIPVRLDSRHAITHDKFMVIDDAAVETGSFNFTRAAETRNAENVLIVHDPDVVRDYADQWQRLWNESDTPNPTNEGNP